MRLENLYSNFGLMSPEDQLNFIINYRLRREEDLSTTSISYKAARIPASKNTITLTEEEKALMKLLGLKKKDIASLKALSIEETDENEVNEPDEGYVPDYSN
jgi:hypothetical protein